MPNETEAVGALAYLEKKYGTSPSVTEIADYLDVSTGTAWKYLQRAVQQKLIAKRKGQFMTLDLAKKFDELK